MNRPVSTLEEEVTDDEELRHCCPYCTMFQNLVLLISALIRPPRRRYLDANDDKTRKYWVFLFLLVIVGGMVAILVYLITNPLTISKTTTVNSFNDYENLLDSYLGNTHNYRDSNTDITCYCDGQTTDITWGTVWSNINNTFFSPPEDLLALLQNQSLAEANSWWPNLTPVSISEDYYDKYFVRGFPISAGTRTFWKSLSQQLLDTTFDHTELSSQHVYLVSWLMSELIWEIYVGTSLTDMPVYLLPINEVKTRFIRDLSIRLKQKVKEIFTSLKIKEDIEYVQDRAIYGAAANQQHSLRVSLAIMEKLGVDTDFWGSFYQSTNLDNTWNKMNISLAQDVSQNDANFTSFEAAFSSAFTRTWDELHYPTFDLDRLTYVNERSITLWKLSKIVDNYMYQASSLFWDELYASTSWYELGTQYFNNCKPSLCSIITIENGSQIFARFVSYLSSICQGGLFFVAFLYSQFYTKRGGSSNKAYSGVNPGRDTSINDNNKNDNNNNNNNQNPDIPLDNFQADAVNNGDFQDENKRENGQDDQKG